MLDHLKRGGALEPFWMGKIASFTSPSWRSLHRAACSTPPSVHPLFLETAEGQERLDRAKQGMRPIDLVQAKEI